jgi:hypothetical protein
LLAAEYTSGGAFIQATVVASHTGSLAAWTQLSASWTLQATTAFVALVLDVYDTAPLGSAGQSVWMDNAQLNAGSVLAPYCELRFAQSPAQMVVSGLLGDLPAPAALSWGTFLASEAKGASINYALARRGSVSSAAVLTAPSIGYYGTTFTPQGTPVLDAAGYGGYYVKATVGTGGWNPRGFSPRASDVAGVYHVFTRYKTADPTPAGVQVRAKTEESLDPWYGSAGTLRNGGTYYGPFQNPLSAAGAWTICDAGPVTLPPFPHGALRDDTQVYEVPRGEWVGTTGGGSEGDASWLCLLPVDGSLLLGVVNYPGNSQVASVTNQWLWGYLDGLLTSRAQANDGPGWTYSWESAAVPNAAHGFGGAGSLSTGAVNINSAADPYLVLDPALTLAGASGVNQLVGYASDQAGAVLPFYGEISYSPLYLWPR